LPDLNVLTDIAAKGGAANTRQPRQHYFRVAVGIMWATMVSLTLPARSYFLGLAASLATVWVIIALMLA
jgi:hypothetical protein